MKVSIITVCYNSEKFIKSAIESVLTQTYADIEYIVVDGLSSDKTVDIIKSYEPLFKGRMRWISEKDKGIYEAMNKGIAMSLGDIVGILNSDDIYENEKVIEKVVSAFSLQNSDGVYGDLVYVRPQNTKKVSRFWKSGKYTKNAFKYGWMPPHPAFFVKKAVYEKYGVFNEKFTSAADYEFLLRSMYKNHCKVAYLPEILVRMRLGGQSNRNIRGRIKANKEDRLAWKENGLKPYFFTFILKPLRKLFQYIHRP